MAIDPTSAPAIARSDPLAWFEMYGKILAPNRKIISPVANHMQSDIAEAWRYFRGRGEPVRIVGMKPRKRGFSTMSVAHLYHDSYNMICTSRIIGTDYKTVSSLWAILERYRLYDQMAWPVSCEVNSRSASWGNGSESGWLTANDAAAGRAGTFHGLIATEVAHWKKAGSSSASAVAQSLLNTQEDEDGTFTIIESTPNGKGNFFHSHWLDAVWLHEMRAGKRGNGYVRIFAPWHSFPECAVAKITDAERAEIDNTLTLWERAAIEKFNLTHGQLLWRRRTIKGRLAGDEEMFDQEYPSDPETAFISSGRLFFPLSGLKRQEKFLAEPKRGNLEANPDNSVRFVPDTPGDIGGLVQIWDAPEVGCDYIIPVDPCTGSSQQSGKDPDTHGVFAIRKGWFKESGLWVRHRAVARIAPPCRLDIDVLAQIVARLSRFYGSCTVAPEVNMDRGLIELLKQCEGIPIYQREVFNQVEKRYTKAYGWHTPAGAGRMQLVDCLKREIRDHDVPGFGIEIPCHHALEQCSHFTTPDNGVPVAEEGFHDDDVLSLAIGMRLIDHARTFRGAVPSLDGSSAGVSRPRKVIIGGRSPGFQGNEW